MTEDEKLINDLFAATEEYLFTAADVISGRAVRYPGQMAETRRKLIETVLKVAKASRAREMEL